MLLSKFVATLQSILDEKGDGKLALECLSDFAGQLLLEVEEVKLVSASDRIHVVVFGEE